MKIYIGMVLCLFGSTFSIAGEITIPNTFTAGTPAKASEVNDNFSAVKIAVDDNNSRILTNTGGISSNDSEIANLSNKSWSKSGNDLYYNSGNIGIGTMNPSGTLQIVNTVSPAVLIGTTNQEQAAFGQATFSGNWSSDATTGDAIVRPDTGKNLILATEPDNVNQRFPARLLVTKDGNVGIGTITPQAKLDIAGDIKFNGQKACSPFLSGNWRDTILVPASWSASTCEAYADVQAAAIMSYNLYCIFEDSFSAGDVNGGIPTPNCGWQVTGASTLDMA